MGILRMKHDVEIFRNFFLHIAEGNTALRKAAVKELSFLSTLFLECITFATGETGLDACSLREFIVVIHKQTGADLDITRHFLLDVITLMSDRNNNNISVEDTIRNME